jgi:predicted nucleotidyltransferase
MNRDAVISRLRNKQARLRELGVLSASLFGSVARGDDTEASDIDIAVRLDPVRIPHGLAYFGFLDDLKAELSEALDRRVDVIQEPASKPRFQRQIDQERIVAF